MLNIEEALKAILDHATLLAPVTMALDEAAGLVLAENVIAHGNVPPFSNSAMDGFAVLAADIQQRRPGALEPVAAERLPAEITPLKARLWPDITPGGDDSTWHTFSIRGRAAANVSRVNVCTDVPGG